MGEVWIFFGATQVPLSFLFLIKLDIHVLGMNEAWLTTLFAYKWLHKFLKALNEVKKMQTFFMPFVGNLNWSLNHLLLKCQ